MVPLVQDGATPDGLDQQALKAIGAGAIAEAVKLRALHPRVLLQFDLDVALPLPGGALRRVLDRVPPPLEHERRRVRARAAEEDLDGAHVEYDGRVLPELLPVEVLVVARPRQGGLVLAGDVEHRRYADHAEQPQRDHALPQDSVGPLAPVVRHQHVALLVLPEDLVLLAFPAADVVDDRVEARDLPHLKPDEVLEPSLPGSPATGSCAEDRHWPKWLGGRQGSGMGCPRTKTDDRFLCHA
mmetsp:Transcript_747/g.2178  ORF Transcript_747/g.2178 Transcript_747/m.2178 type:complete len:241 (-) Transcript_747:21-743(-)